MPTATRQKNTFRRNAASQKKPDFAGILAIIPAAGKPTNKIIPNKNLPDTMLPINGKPVIGHILDDLLARRISRAALVLHKEDKHTEIYAKKMYGSRLNLSIHYNQHPERGVVHTISIAVSQTPQARSILVYLGDTIYKGTLSFDRDFVVVSHPISESSKWCFVETDGNTHTFINKPSPYSGSGKILCGVYYFRDAEVIRNYLANATEQEKKLELADILTHYSHQNQMRLVPADQWFDCGNIENYYKAKVHFLKTREFNEISYNDTYGYVTKTSTNKKKISDEIAWYKNIPAELAIFAPRLVRAQANGRKPSYSTEFYGYQSLADLLLFESLDIRLWQTIIKKLFTTLSLFRKYHALVPKRHFEDIYYKKTVSRLSLLRKEPYWRELLRKEQIIINGRAYQNVDHFLPHIKKKLSLLWKKGDMTFLHGDFCLSNILYDPSSNILKCIDPRGSFGKTSVYGDHKYDVAKLRHSFHGLYDYIVSDLFALTEQDGMWKLEFFTNTDTEVIAEIFEKELARNGYTRSSIALIEALLFISMIPLHADNKKRQTAMFLRGVQLINGAFGTHI